MSPEARAGAAAIARLRRELQSDRVAIAAHAAEVRELLSGGPLSGDRGQLARAAVALHAWYTGLERMVERVARELDREVPTGDRSHSELLVQATTEVPHLRPAVLSPGVHAELKELLDFRHFFRHAYAAALDTARLQENAGRLLRIEQEVARSLDAFDLFLSETADALSRG